MSKVIELTDENFKETIAKAPLAFVDFYADWCGPCRLFAPVFASVAQKHPDIAFFKIDGDSNPESRSEMTIDNLPYIVAFRNGRFIEGFSTAIESGLENFIARMREAEK